MMGLRWAVEACPKVSSIQIVFYLILPLKSNMNIILLKQILNFMMTDLKQILKSIFTFSTGPILRIRG